MDAGFVIGEEARQHRAGVAPVQPQVVGGHRHQHRAHPEVDPAGGLQRAHAGVHEGDAGLSPHPCPEAGGVGRARAQPFAGGVQAAVFQRRLVLELLDEMVAPGEARLEGAQTSGPAVAHAAQSALPRGGGPGGLAHRQGAKRQVRRKARTGLCPLQRRRHGAAIVAATLGQEAVERPQHLGAAAALATRAGIGAQAEPRGPGPGVAPGGHRLQPLRHRHRLGEDEAIAPGGPAVAALQPAHHAGLRQFFPDDALRARPPPHCPVAGIGPGVSRFLVAEEVGRAMRAAQRLQHLHRRTHAHDQIGTETREIPAQRCQRLRQEGVVPPARVRLRPEVRLDDVERQHRQAACRGARQRRVVRNPQVALEPQDRRARLRSSHSLAVPCPSH